MPVLRLTSKLLAEIDDVPSLVSAPTPSPIGDWYGQIFTVDRRKCILFIHDPTLFVSLTCWVVKSDYRHILPFFRETLIVTLRNQVFNQDQIDWILGLHKDLTIGRTENRTMIGCLNNRVSNTKAIIEWHGGYADCDWGAVNIMLNQTPMKPIGYSNGLEKMQELLARLAQGIFADQKD